MKMKKTIALIAACIVISLGVVGTAIALSGLLKDRRNSFLRVFPPHPASSPITYDLEFNSYYIAGVDSNGIYFGNYYNPLTVILLDQDLAKAKEFTISAPGIFETKFWSLRLTVQPPNFFLYDGAVPRIYEGDIRDWMATQSVHDREYFQEMVPLPFNGFALKFITSETSESMMAKLDNDSPYFHLRPKILTKQIDGVFCTDGQMAFNEQLNVLIYLYRYRNQYIMMNPDVRLVGSGRTIDSVSIAKIKVGVVDGKHMLAEPPIEVNKQVATFGNLLLVNSRLLSRNEPTDAHQSASVIDVYDLSKREYKFSFYIHDFEGKEKLREFALVGNRLYIVYDRHVQMLILRSDYLKPTV